MDRSVWREHPLDGATLWFQPATGLHVRVERPATSALRRRAPRVVMFGITNACNLACEFCSRDIGRDSTWTVADAADVLRGLSAAGTLEVAYGGGEPFAFRGFAELVAEVDATTPLAQHVTTNGTLIRAATWPRFAGRFGQVRVSIYDDTWREPARVLASHGQRWGANVIVDDTSVATLPVLLADLASHGASDVSLLSYVGPDVTRQLGRAAAARVAAMIADSPVPCRLSVCLGDRVPTPRLFAGADGSGDCGAGLDFISITPDRRVQSCSFQERSLAGGTADEILAAWRTQQAMLASPSPRRGCARLLPLASAPPRPPPIAVWQAFSGNNSGECVFAATFETVDDAEAYLADVVPGWHRDLASEPAWQALIGSGALGPTDLLDEGAGEVVSIGRMVLASTYAAEDALSRLRASAWQRGARVASGGVHLHGAYHLLTAVRARDDEDARTLAKSPEPPLLFAIRHGATVLAAAGVSGNLAAARDAITSFVGNRRFAVEALLDDDDDYDHDHDAGSELEAAVVAALTRLADPVAERPRLVCQWWGPDRATHAQQFAAMLEPGRVVHVDGTVLVDPAPDRKRLAVLAYRAEAAVHALDGSRVRLVVQPWFEPPPPTKGRKPEPRTVDIEAIAATLRGLSPGSSVVVEPLRYAWHASHRIVITTDEPLAILRAVGAIVRELGASCSFGLSDRDPVGPAVRRLWADLGSR